MRSVLFSFGYFFVNRKLGLPASFGHDEEKSSTTATKMSTVDKVDMSLGKKTVIFVSCELL